nr:hypothetical protein [uncultured Catonella sp.]
MANYTEQEEKELNSQLRKWQRRAKRLILSDYYDTAAKSLSDLNYTALKAVTNAKTHKDISYYLWNSVLIESTLDRITKKMKEARKEDRKRR